MAVISFECVGNFQTSSEIDLGVIQFDDEGSDGGGHASACRAGHTLLGSKVVSGTEKTPFRIVP